MGGDTEEKKGDFFFGATVTCVSLASPISCACVRAYDKVPIAKCEATGPRWQQQQQQRNRRVCVTLGHRAQVEPRQSPFCCDGCMIACPFGERGSCCLFVPLNGIFTSLLGGWSPGQRGKEEEEEENKK